VLGPDDDARLDSIVVKYADMGFIGVIYDCRIRVAWPLALAKHNGRTTPCPHISSFDNPEKSSFRSRFKTASLSAKSRFAAFNAPRTYTAPPESP
jgi:hypothetical protein